MSGARGTRMPEPETRRAAGKLLEHRPDLVGLPLLAARLVEHATEAA